MIQTVQGLVVQTGKATDGEWRLEEGTVQSCALPCDCPRGIDSSGSPAAGQPEQRQDSMLRGRSDPSSQNWDRIVDLKLDALTEPPKKYGY